MKSAGSTAAALAFVWLGASVTTLGTTLVTTLVTTASAQELAVDPDSGEIRDYDQDREDYSEFWERAVSPAAGTYQDLVTQAVSIINNSRKPISDARTLLTDAIASRPDAPLAHFWLGFLEKKAGNHAACATSFSAARRIEPGFRPPPNTSRLPSGWQLDYDLGLCYALSGELDNALDRFSAITARYPSCRTKRVPDCTTWSVPWRHGETLMALGRLEEAIVILEGADDGAILLRYTLAIALERDEQLARSKKLVAQIVSSDRSLRTLSATGRDYIPATDELYYRGVVHASRREMAHARLFFSAYVEKAPDSPWLARAKVHQQASADGGGASALLDVQNIELAVASKALSASYAELEKCAEKHPSQLFEVRVNQRLRADGPRGKKIAVTRSVIIQHHDPLRVQPVSTEVIEITTCLRRVGNAIKLPKPKGAAGTSAYLRFYVAAKN